MFDLGGVLVDWDPRHLYRALFGGDTAAMEHFLGHVCTHDWHYQHDLGRPMSETCAELAAAHPGQEPLIWAWRDRAEEMIGAPIEGTVEVLRKVRARGVPCYALSNWPLETFHLCRRRFGFLSLFDGIVISGEEGVAKPDPEIFRRLIGRYGLRPEATVFVDDHPAHVETAAGLGFRTIRYEGPRGLRRRLAELGLLA
ncbi:MAG TPA: HAD family phosphatase [Acidimicrobiales bacterium]|nr:HAD family phosphatase [Acidimicrobiales bacterium]